MLGLRLRSIVPDANAAVPSPTTADGSTSTTDRSVTHAHTSTSLITHSATPEYFGDDTIRRLMKRGERHKRCSLGRPCQGQSKGKSKSSDQRSTHISPPVMVRPRLAVSRLHRRS